MARLLGRRHARGLSLNCAIREGRYCADCGWDGRLGARAAKRLEARELAAEVTAVLGKVPPAPILDGTPDECMHGCNGSPCGLPCRFWCHDADGTGARRG